MYITVTVCPFSTQATSTLLLTCFQVNLVSWHLAVHNVIKEIITIMYCQVHAFGIGAGTPMAEVGERNTCTVLFEKQETSFLLER